VPGGLDPGQESECGTGLFRVAPPKAGTEYTFKRVDGQAAGRWAVVELRQLCFGQRDRSSAPHPDWLCEVAAGEPGMRKANGQEHVYRGPLVKTPLSGEGLAFLAPGGELIAASVWRQR
jgi:hypothetical protein